MEPRSEYTDNRESEVFLEAIKDTIRFAKIQLYKEAMGTNPFLGVVDNEQAREEAERKVEEFYSSTARHGSYETPNGTREFNEESFTTRGKDGTILPGPEALRLLNVFVTELMSGKAGEDTLPNKE